MKKHARIFALLLAVALVATMMAACSPATGSSTSTGQQSSSSQPTSTSSTSSGTQWPETIQCAYIGPFTGNYSLYGTEKSNAIKMMIEEINAAGGIKSMGGAKIEFEYHDDKNDAKESVIVANKVVTNQNVVACFGPFSTGNGLAIKEIFNTAKIPLISTSISNPSFAEDYDYCFSASATQYDFMRIYADFLQTNLPEWKKVAVLWANSEWGQSVYDALETNFAKAGIEISYQENYEIGTKDFKSQLTKFKSADADFIYLAGHIAECGPIVNQMAELKVGLPIMSSNSLLMQEYIEIVGENGEGQIILSYFSPSNDNPQAFEDYRKRYLERFTDIKSVDGHIAGMGDAMLMIRDVLEHIGENELAVTPAEMRQAITDTIPKLTFQGMVVEYTYTDYGQILKELVPCVLHDDKFVKWTPEVWAEIHA